MGAFEKVVFKHGAKLKKSCLLIDLPPFGESGVPLNFNIFTYTHMVICLMDKVGIKKANFITHSFGSRIGIVMSGVRRDLVSKLVIISGAGMKPRRGVRYFFKIFKAKLYRLFKIKKALGSSDYKNLSFEMKLVFKNVVNEHLEGYAKKITAKTLLIYGDKDAETPLYMAKRLDRLIKRSRLEVLKGEGHFCFLECAFKVNRLVKSFLEEE